MQPIIQCVPNFSEGRRPDVVEAIADAARAARVIDYSSDPDHNRMVLTLLGSPGEIRDAVFAAASRAVEEIDMRAHSGVHPRIGAVDVVPLVPVSGIGMEECVELSYQIGNDISRHLGVPVYFYERSAVLGHRVNLADVRRGGFERLSAGLLSGERAPDLGPPSAHPTAGVTVVGARGPLVAFNVILDSEDLAAAKEIAAKVRATLPGVKAIGVPLASRSEVQVSMNITRPEEIAVGEVYRFVEAEARGLVVESEIIGCLAARFLGAEPEEIRAFKFAESQILDNWL
ncbi:MAG: glutamate formimidoyltransferase [Armatimonadota bacterium]